MNATLLHPLGTIYFDFSLSATLWRYAPAVSSGQLVPGGGTAWSARAALVMGVGEAAWLTEPPWSPLGLLWNPLCYAHSPCQPRWEPS